MKNANRIPGRRVGTDRATVIHKAIGFVLAVTLCIQLLPGTVWLRSVSAQSGENFASSYIPDTDYGMYADTSTENRASSAGKPVKRPTIVDYEQEETQKNDSCYEENLFEQIHDYGKLAEISDSLKGEKKTGTQSKLSSVYEITETDDGIGAPYTFADFDSERVNLNTGALIHERIDYVLPGVNGLDLVIGRRYDSSSARTRVATIASQEITAYELYINGVFEAEFFVGFFAIIH